jgi:polysaccharide export outer membrane protein
MFTIFSSLIGITARHGASARSPGAEIYVMSLPRSLSSVSILIFMLLAADVGAQEESEQVGSVYTVQPGDVLQVSVWNESELQKEILVAPDGGISFPLVGELNVIGKSAAELRQQITQRLGRYISEPIVTVTISEVLGNKIYVLGQVNRPGDFIVNPMVDVMQALSMAGGTTAFASLNNIVILRRNGSQQRAIRFKYSDASSGKDLDLNIILQSGDVVVVP